jgi:uncharacterized membrane protein
MRKDTTAFVATRLIKKLSIPVTEKTIVEELQMHPDRGTLLAISEVFDRFYIPNEAFRVQVDELTKIACPFIIHLTYKGGKFAILTHIDEEKAIISNESFTNHIVSREVFNKAYNGTALVAEAAADSGQKDYRQRRQNEILDVIRIPFIVSCLLLIMILVLLKASSILTWNTGLLILLKSAGLIISTLLLIQSVDSANPLVQFICSHSEKVDCNRILTSPAARLHSALSWSEVGFFYFGGTWLTLLFNSGSLMLIQFLGIFNLLALPYTFYSIYYQARIAKAWCLLCCIVQALLWLEFFAFLPNILHPLAFPGTHEITNLFIATIIPVLLWAFIKPYLLQSKQAQSLKLNLNRFKFNHSLFSKLLSEQPAHNIPNDEFSITLGNKNAEHTITMVSNPYCQPCSFTHKLLDQWLSDKEDMRLQIIFHSFNDEEKSVKVAKHFLSLQAKQDEHLLKQALHDWYDQKYKNYEYLATRYPVT